MNFDAYYINYFDADYWVTACSSSTTTNPSEVAEVRRIYIYLTRNRMKNEYVR